MIATQSKRCQRGLTTVEFSVVGLLLFVVLFGVFEISRMMWVFNALDEVTRRGARMAAVCQVNDPAIQQVAIFNASGDAGPSRLIGGLTTGNIELNYLDIDGNTLAEPADVEFIDIEFVQVAITGFQHQVLIPTLFWTMQAPPVRTTLPRESLGVSREGITPC
jgi:hypothetical protein